MVGPATFRLVTNEPPWVICMEALAPSAWMASVKALRSGRISGRIRIPSSRVRPNSADGSVRYGGHADTAARQLAMMFDQCL